MLVDLFRNVANFARRRAAIRRNASSPGSRRPATRFARATHETTCRWPVPAPEGGLSKLAADSLGPPSSDEGLVRSSPRSRRPADGHRDRDGRARLPPSPGIAWHARLSRSFALPRSKFKPPCVAMFIQRPPARRRLSRGERRPQDARKRLGQAFLVRLRGGDDHMQRMHGPRHRHVQHAQRFAHLQARVVVEQLLQLRRKKLPDFLVRRAADDVHRLGRSWPAGDEPIGLADQLRFQLRQARPRRTASPWPDESSSPARRPTCGSAIRRVSTSRKKSLVRSVLLG